MKVVLVGRAALALLIAATAAASLPSRAQCDTTAPSFTAFGFAPSSVNTTSASQNVTCTITVTDDIAGVAQVGCSFQSPSFMHSVSCSSVTPSSGTPQNGTYSCVVSLPRYAETGVWRANLSATDAVGNDASLSWFLFPPGFPTALTVTSDPDTIAPALTGFTLGTPSIDTSSSSQNVTCNMTVTDAKSGVSTASCAFSAPGSSQARGCSSNAPASGTRQSGTFSCAAAFPRYSDAGTWTTSVFLADGAGNFGTGTPTTTLAVTSVPEDITGPSETSFDFNPKSISVGTGPRAVTCTMIVADSPAGVDVASCGFGYTDPNTSTTYQQQCVATAPSAGTRNNGTFSCNVLIPQFSPGGSWTADTSYVDLAGNSSQFTSIVPLVLDCSTADPETTVRFDDHNTLAWTAIAGATRYNTYRGDLSGFVDLNADHFPDGGYGTCQNSRDAILTDLQFVDTDVPTSLQIGFEYLVSDTTGGVEKGLGTNSFGGSRTVAAPCP
jgi:hypothetical protein